MGRTTFFEEGEFFLYCVADQLQDGRWAGSVIFERKRDHSGVRVPGVRYRLKDVIFEKESDAIVQAHQFGLDLIRADKVEFD